MASRQISDLAPETGIRAERVRTLCEAAGIELLIYCTLRPLDEQARLWRQSRSRQTIDKKLASFQERKLGFLAEILDGVGPQSGKHVTNAAPGESFHNYGLAFDAVPIDGGKCCWKYGDRPDLWQGYGEAARQNGLHWAGDWTGFREYPHAQDAAGGNPLRTNDPGRIREMLQQNGLL